MLLMLLCTTYVQLLTTEYHVSNPIIRLSA